MGIKRELALTGGWDIEMMKGVLVRSTFAKSAWSQLYCKHTLNALKATTFSLSLLASSQCFSRPTVGPVKMQATTGAVIL